MQLPAGAEYLPIFGQSWRAKARCCAIVGELKQRVPIEPRARLVGIPDLWIDPRRRQINTDGEAANERA